MYVSTPSLVLLERQIGIRQDYVQFPFLELKLTVDTWLSQGRSEPSNVETHQLNKWWLICATIRMAPYAVLSMALDN